MRIELILGGGFCALISWIPLVLWYILDVFSGGLCSVATCCLGDLFVWLLSGVLFFGGITLLIIGIVKDPKQKA